MWIGSAADAASLRSTIADHVPEATQLSFPTGTLIGPPRSTTSAPRRARSVVSWRRRARDCRPVLLHLGDQLAILDRDPQGAVDLGEVVRETASMTTPLISISFPTFWPFELWSGMRLLQRDFGWAAALHARRTAADYPLHALSSRNRRFRFAQTGRHTGDMVRLQT